MSNKFGTAVGEDEDSSAGIVTIAVAGDSLETTSLLKLFGDVGNVRVAAVVCPSLADSVVSHAKAAGIRVISDPVEVLELADLELIIDVTQEAAVSAALQAQKPSGVEILGPVASELIRDLLVAKKRGKERERFFLELQTAYEKIRSHEHQLRESTEALEQANMELENRLAEIFFIHEFLKALTSFDSVEDVCELIVDGANGILGAEVSCVYLFEREERTFRLRASQGRPGVVFEPVVPAAETILGQAFEEGLVQEDEIPLDAASSRWVRDTSFVRSQVALRLRSGDHMIGVLVIAWAVNRELSPPELERLQVIGNQSSLSLQNALLHGEMQRLSVTDRLTELYNHGYFKQRLDEEVERAKRFHHPLSLLMLDIDDFKDLNDTFGHTRGDDVLKSVSAIVRDSLREIDLAARYGGEEFVVLLPETGPRGATLVAERIRSGVQELSFSFGEGTEDVRISVSVGAATLSDDAGSGKRLVDAADNAMYEAKRSGKNQVKVAK